MNVRTSRFPLVDSLRALAALAVLGFHAAFFSRLGLSDSFLRPYAAHLDVGVTVFFLISGFLLYRPFVRARLRGEGSPHVGAYAWRRFLRIVPAYWVALTAVALALGLWRVFSAEGIPIYYGFAQIYSAELAPGGIEQAWTLCVEVTFYALLPLWALLMRRLPGQGSSRRVLVTELSGLALMFAASVAYKMWALHQVDVNSLSAPPWLQPLPNFLDAFALGMGLAVLSAWYEERPDGQRRALPAPLRAVARFPALPWLGAAVAFWAVSTQIGYTGELIDRSTRTMFLARHELYALVALGVLLPAVFGDPGRGLIRRALGSRALLYLGLISYGIYLYHFAVLKFVDSRWHEALVDGLPAGVGWQLGVHLAIGFAGALALGSVSYYLVERPALSLKRRVGPRMTEGREEAITEPAPVAPATAPRA